MHPGDQVEYVPSQLVLYNRGSQGAGSLPLAGATITVPIYSSVVRSSGQQILNFNTGLSQGHGVNTGTHGLKRVGGLWFVDVFLFQVGGPATLELRERTFDGLTQFAVGTTDTTRSVWIRQIRAGVVFRVTWRLENAESRINYVNGASNTTTFDFHVQARAL